MRHGTGLLASLLVAGCMSAGDGEALQRDVEQLKRALADQRAQAESGRQQLQKVLEQATALLTRNSADVGADLERLQLKVSHLTGAAEETAQAVEQLRRDQGDFKTKVEARLEAAAKVGTTSPTTTEATAPSDKDELYRLATAKTDAGDQNEARRFFRLFIARFPDEPRVPNAQLRLGDSYFAEQKFAPAIQEYRKIIEQYKKSEAVPKALYQIGMSFYELKFCSDARSFLEDLVQRYKDHADVQQAKRVLKLIERYRKNTRICSS